MAVQLQTMVGATFGPSGANHAQGLVPDPGSSAGTTRFLREDSTWGLPSNGANPFQAGASLYPFISASHFKYDANSAVLANTLGCKNLVAGLPSQDTNVTWVNTYLVGADATGQVTVYGTHPAGIWGSVFASRSSDNPSGTPQNVIGEISVGVHDNTSVGHSVWGHYTATAVTAAAAAGQVLGYEISIFSNATAVSKDPYTINPAGGTEILRLDSAVNGGIGGNSVGVALGIVPNGAKCITGINFGNGSLDTSVNAQPPAIALPIGYATKWYSAASTVAGEIYEDSFTIATGANHPLGSGAGMIVVHDITDADVAIYLVAGASGVKVSSIGGFWGAFSSTPGAGTLSVGWNGSVYTVYNNQGNSRTVTVACIFTKPSP